MTDVLWTSGHLGWGVFALAVFTALWCLLTDLIWRMKSARFGRLMVTMGAGWVVGGSLIVLGTFMAQRGLG